VTERDLRERSVIYISNPPYGSLIECVPLTELPVMRGGAIILICSHLPALVARVAKTAPSALILVQLRPGHAIGLTDVERLRNAGAAGLSAVDSGTPEPAGLMQAARMASRTARGQIGPRLRLLGHSIPAQFEVFLEVLVDSPPSWRTGDWAAAVGESVRTLERHARRWGMPSPRRWMELVRVIRAVQAVQARPRDSVEAALAGSGFQNVRRTRGLVTRICGESPARVRGLIGWYWILERWVAARQEPPGHQSSLL